MGCRTQNIDRIAAEGARFTHYYGEQSCTVGRAAFITGQDAVRIGLTKVGMPFGNPYHLNAEEEPEDPDYPDTERCPNFRENFGPRGVIHSSADGRIEDTGSLTKKRMETIDDQIITPAPRFVHNATEADTPFFVQLQAGMSSS